MFAHYSTFMEGASTTEVRVAAVSVSGTGCRRAYACDAPAPLQFRTVDGVPEPGKVGFGPRRKGAVTGERAGSKAKPSTSSTELDELAAVA